MKMNPMHLSEVGCPQTGMSTDWETLQQSTTSFETSSGIMADSFKLPAVTLFKFDHSKHPPGP